MVSYNDLTKTLHAFGLGRDIPVIAHIGADLPGKVKGGLSTFMGALLSTVDNVLLPAFTFSTMVIPQHGPPENAMQYGENDEQNMQAAIFSHNLPSECGNQDAIDILNGFPGVYRSGHPIFSFYGLGLDIALLNHHPDETYFPIRKMRELHGWVLLADVEADRNFSMHYAEMLAGRKQFLRWALTANGAVACPYFPGCSNGFHKLDYYLHNELHKSTMENLTLSAVPLETLITTTIALLKEDPFALLCNDLDCVRCNLVRKDAKQKVSGHWQPENRNR